MIRWQLFPLFCALSLQACTNPAPPTTARAKTTSSEIPAVRVESVIVPQETTFDGVVEAVEQSTVAAQTNGRVVALPFDVGDYVKKGAVIVQLTSNEQMARVDAAEGARAEAGARLAEAQLTYKRTREVYKQNLIPKAKFDSAAANLKSAQARVKATEAALTGAREGLQYTVIRAPYSGTVASRHVQLGETVSPGKPLMTGLSLKQLRVVVEIPQHHIGPLRLHRQARVILPDGRSVKALSLRIPPNADPRTHTFRVRVTLPADNFGIFPGMLVKVAFISDESRELLVPASAVVRRGEVSALYVIDTGGRISFRYVRTGTATTDGRIPVLAGLDRGERVATDPVRAAISYKQQHQRQGNSVKPGIRS